MATKFDTTEFKTSPFMTALLAPLPAEVTQVDAKQFLKAIAKDAQDVWDKGMRHVRVTNHGRNLHWEQYCIALDKKQGVADAKSVWDEAEAEHYVEVSRQMQIPAPGKTALKWKRDMRKYQGGHANWEAAIVRDEARLA